MYWQVILTTCWILEVQIYLLEVFKKIATAKEKLCDIMFALFFIFIFNSMFYICVV